MYHIPWPESPPNERREWPRYAADGRLPISIEFRGRPYLCALLNISLGGACVSFLEGKVPASTSLLLRHPGVGTVRLERRWQSGQLAGVLFEYSDNALRLVRDCLQEIMAIGQGQATADPPLP